MSSVRQLLKRLDPDIQVDALLQFIEKQGSDGLATFLSDGIRKAEFPIRNWSKLRDKLEKVVAQEWKRDPSGDVEIRLLARRLHIPQAVVVLMVEESEVLDLGVGYQVGGPGGGHHEEHDQGSWTVEWLGVS